VFVATSQENSVAVDGVLVAAHTFKVVMGQAAV
jgi:hypothetical protein